MHSTSYLMEIDQEKDCAHTFAVLISFITVHIINIIIYTQEYLEETIVFILNRERSSKVLDN